MSRAGQIASDFVHCNYDCCIPQEDSPSEVSKVNRIKMAEVAFVAAAIVLTLLTLASHYTNFTQTLPPPGALVTTTVAKVAITKATMYFIIATGVSALIAVALEVARSSAQRSLNEIRAPRGGDDADDVAARSKQEFVRSLEQHSVGGVAAGLGRTDDHSLSLVLNERTGETAFHLLANVVAAPAVAVVDGAKPAQVQIVELLAQKAVPGVINAQLADSGDTALHIATRYRNEELRGALLANGANPDLLNAARERADDLSKVARQPAPPVDAPRPIGAPPANDARPGASPLPAGPDAANPASPPAQPAPVADRPAPGNVNVGGGGGPNAEAAAAAAVGANPKPAAPKS